MDNDRFRASQPSNRRVVNGSSDGRQASYRREEEAVQTVRQPEEERVERVPAPQQPPKPRRLWPLFVVLLVIVLAAAGWFGWSHLRNSETGIKADKYQAVFLSNGQIYFGKLTLMNDNYLKLTDVFYLEKAAETDATSTSTTQPVQASLRKLGVKDVHGPEDAMFISRDQVLMYENLTDKGQVVKAIDQYKQQAQ